MGLRRWNGRDEYGLYLRDSSRLSIAPSTSFGPPRLAVSSSGAARRRGRGRGRGEYGRATPRAKKRITDATLTSLLCGDLDLDYTLTAAPRKRKKRQEEERAHFTRMRTENTLIRFRMDCVVLNDVCTNRHCDSCASRVVVKW